MWRHYKVDVALHLLGCLVLPVLTPDDTQTFDSNK